MIAVIDYGMGNVGSIINMFHKLHENAVLASEEATIAKADHLLLPGVGAFDNGINKLRELNLLDPILRFVESGKPFLGICLGMQMLGRCSEEGKEKGLSLIDFENKRFSFPFGTNLKIPHMGWNIAKAMHDDPIFRDVEKTQRYYFVHSYHAVCDKKEDVLMTCEYGYEFAAAVKHDNIYGFQFHPEKSHKFGMILLNNFARLK